MVAKTEIFQTILITNHSQKSQNNKTVTLLFVTFYLHPICRILWSVKQKMSINNPPKVVPTAKQCLTFKDQNISNCTNLPTYQAQSCFSILWCIYCFYKKIILKNPVYPLINIANRENACLIKLGRAISKK